MAADFVLISQFAGGLVMLSQEDKARLPVRDASSFNHLKRARMQVGIVFELRRVVEDLVRARSGQIAASTSAL